MKRTIFAFPFLFMFLSAGSLCAQEISFAAAREYPINGGAQFVAVGDFNGDGRPDLALTTVSPPSVSILLGKEDGTFNRGNTYSITIAQYAEYITAADFNGDGKLDLAVSSISDYGLSPYGLSIFLGNGDGSFQPPINYSPTFFGNIAVGDFNGDGKPDLALTGAGTGAGILIMRGNGDGTFQPPVTYASGYTYYSIAVGDFNADGRLDVAAADYAGNSVSVLLGSGNGTLQAPTNFAVGAGPISVAVADFNGDGQADILTANATANSVSILLGNGNGGFLPASSYPATVYNSQELAVADLNGDGKPDVALSGFPNPGAISVLLNAGDGSLRPAISYPGPAAGAGVAAGDFHGDGKPDLVVAGEMVGILRNRGDGTFPSPRQYQLSGNLDASQVVTGDFNHDGTLDMAVVGADAVSVLLGKPNGTFQQPVTYPVGQLLTAVAVGDFNGDGKLDLVVADNSPTGDVEILLGNGDGTFQAPVTYAAGLGPISVAIGDFNGDGKPDLVVGHGRGQYAISVMLGNGDGTFQSPTTMSAQGVPVALVVGDFNGDGILDIASANQDPGNVAIFLGKGDGTFQPPLLYEVGYTIPSPDTLASGDLNGDGKLDLVVATRGYAVVLLGNGDGTFRNLRQYAAGALPEERWAGGVVVADFDGDGFPDLAVADGAELGGSVAILRGRGDGTFFPAQYFDMNISYNLAVWDSTPNGRPGLILAGGSLILTLNNTSQ